MFLRFSQAVGQKTQTRVGNRETPLVFIRHSKKKKENKSVTLKKVFHQKHQKFSR